MHETKTETKLNEELKCLNEICKKLEEKFKNELDKGIEYINNEDLNDVSDAIKDICEAKEKIIKGCYYKSIIAAMEKEEEKIKEEEKAWEKAREMMSVETMQNMPNQKMYYRGQPRSSTSGRYMRRGDGRRRYTEPMLMPMDEYDPYMQAYLRGEPDRMYYEDNIRSTGTSTATASGEPHINPNEINRYYSGMGSNRSSSSSNNGMSSGSTNSGKSSNSRSYYMESKEMNSGNSVHDNNIKVQSLKRYAKDLSEDIAEMIDGSSKQEKEMLRQELKQLADQI